MVPEIIDPKTFGICAAGFSDLCALGSPWLFTPMTQTRHTLVDRFNVFFDNTCNQELRDGFWEEWQKRKEKFAFALTLDREENFIVIDKAGYAPWAHLFEFDWETLDLMVSDTDVFFRDSIGRISVDRFRPSDRDSSRVRLDDVGIIPWLHCLS
jgi:hypothetical protein